jgi:hypothetical protein
MVMVLVAALFAWARRPATSGSAAVTATEPKPATTVQSHHPLQAVVVKEVGVWGNDIASATYKAALPGAAGTPNGPTTQQTLEEELAEIARLEAQLGGQVEAAASEPYPSMCMGAPSAPKAATQQTLEEELAAIARLEAQLGGQV